MCTFGWVTALLCCALRKVFDFPNICWLVSAKPVEIVIQSDIRSIHSKFIFVAEFLESTCAHIRLFVPDSLTVSVRSKQMVWQKNFTHLCHCPLQNGDSIVKNSFVHSPRNQTPSYWHSLSNHSTDRAFCRRSCKLILFETRSTLASRIHLVRCGCNV